MRRSCARGAPASLRLRAHRRFTCVVALAVGLPAAAVAQAAEADLCRPLTFEQANYRVCSINLSKHRLRLMWKSPSGAPYGSLRGLLDAARGREILFAMNGGMYHENGLPVGIYVENGKELRKLDRTSGEGNFYLKPNGVFFGDRRGAHILDTEQFARLRPRADFATQSGPILVIDRQFHPAFRPDSPSIKHRTGVGIRDAQNIVFAISEDEVTFHAFARLFRDGLGSANALYLDGGSVASLYSRSYSRRTTINLVPIIAVTK